MADQKYLRDNLRFCLAHAIEECGEFLAAAGKTQRWGLQSYNPELKPKQRETNVRWLLREMDDLEGAITRLRKKLAEEGCESTSGGERLYTKADVEALCAIAVAGKSVADSTPKTGSGASRG